MDFLTRYKTEYKKIRLGSDYDGGYIIADGLTYDTFISCGIADDVTFENDFIRKYNVTECFAFDGTIEKLPTNSDKNITFVKKNISSKITDNTTNLSDYVCEKNNIFLKMDIETNEYQWLEVTSSEHMNKFIQIVIEIHFPFTYSETLFSKLSYSMSVEKKINLIKKINNTHYLIHLHPNSCCGTTRFHNIIVPNVLEFTFLRKDLCSNVSVDTSPIPNKLLDRPNRKNEHEIVFNY